MSLPTTIADAPFLADPALARVLAAVARGGDVARVVGGAVRNTLLGEPVEDVDIATTARPETVMERARSAGLKPVPTGVEHGTVTVVANGHPFEVTTLRADVETDGRRAVVAFTADWTEDAARRDFTMNAIYADADGTLFDPVGGIADALARRVRFIGSPEARIREDYLRILRFFRFHARYGHGRPDADGLASCVALQEGLDRLSRERIGMEMRKLMVARCAPETLALMHEVGILDRVIAGPAWPERLAFVRAAVPECGLALGLAAVAADRPDDADRIADRLRLSNAERECLRAYLTVAETLGASPDEPAVRLAVYRAGNRITAGALAIAAARAGRPASAFIELASTWQAPRFPVTGKDLLAAGLPPGPEIGQRLKEMEEAWIAGGYGEAT